MSWSRGQRRVIPALLATLALAGCTDRQCQSAICGCWEPAEVALDIEVLDELGRPVPGASAFCVNEDDAVAVAGDDGLLAATLETRVSPGCGVERCSSLTILDPSGRCEGVESTLSVLNESTVTLACAQ